MLHGRPGGEVCPSSSAAAPRPEPLSVSCQQIVAVSEMEHPQDMAKQALAATGGKSNLKATKWLLERRAEVVQLHHVDADELGQTHPKKIAVDEIVNHVVVGEGREEETPSSPSLWSNNVVEQHEDDPDFATVARVDGAVAIVNRAANLQRNPMGIGFASTSALERHPSVGSSGSGLREEAAEVQLHLKLQPTVNQQEPIKSFRRSLSPELEETSKLNVPKVAPAWPVTAAASSLHDGGNLKRKWQDEVNISTVRSGAPSSPLADGFKSHTQLSGKNLTALAERMRPNSIAEILGQDHLLGPYCVLRSLLDGESLPSIVFGGPPGTGKTSLARLIARSASCRFVVLPPENFEIHDILEEAKQIRKFGQRTVLFVETLSTLSKPNQEYLLSAIESGYIVFIGATTENPSAELLPNLFLRCRVFMLRKLQHEHLCCVMKRAIYDIEKGVQVTLGDVPGIEVLAIEDDVIQFLATAADGNARVALNALEAAVCTALGKLKQRCRLELNRKTIQELETEEVPHKERERLAGNAAITKRDTPHNILEHLKGYFQFSQEEYVKPFKKIVGGKEVTQGVGSGRELQKLISDVGKEDASGGNAITDTDFDAKGTSKSALENALVVTMLDAKESFPLPLAAKEKIWHENDADLISAMLKAIRGGDSNAAIYWLARVAVKVEDPLKIMEVLTKFASEEIGMADPQALVQAVACRQACQFMGGKECHTYLTQCVVYLAMAPKSDVLPKAFQSAQKVIQEHKSEPVPNHLRSSSGGYMREPCYLPTSLQHFTFLRFPDAK